MVRMTTTLITGANKGLGYETARRLIEAGHDVWMAARDPARGRDAADALGGRFVLLDVTGDASVAAARRTLEEAGGGLDVLINNAGITGRRVTVPETTAADVEPVLDTNVLGPLRVLHAFASLLARSPAGVVVNVSSGMGSMTITTDPERLESGIVALGYPASKAALNMLTTQYAKAYPDLRVNCVDPGYTATDLNDNTGTQTVEEGAEIIVRMAQVAADGPTGRFFDARGEVPW
jgi:NAD(P)-dependent dehydrogenase (short-subunit alcohol dehydrogenase family)